MDLRVAGHVAVVTGASRGLGREAVRGLVAEIPLGRIVEPEELVGLAVFLASRASDYITGHTIPFDGAWHDVIVDIPPEAFAPDALGREVNEVFFQLLLDPPQEGTTLLFADDVRFFEWREARFLPDGFFQVDAVRAAAPGVPVSATLERIGD